MRINQNKNKCKNKLKKKSFTSKINRFNKKSSKGLSYKSYEKNKTIFREFRIKNKRRG